MRVMLVIAGNVSYIVRDMSETKIYIGLKHYRHYPHHPQSERRKRYSLAFPFTGNANPVSFAMCGLKTYSTRTVTL